MMSSVRECLVFSFAVFHLGSALQCYSCRDLTGQCTKTETCSPGNECLWINTKGGINIQQCIPASSCSIGTLNDLFPGIPSITFKCCNRDLCNGSPVHVPNKPLLGLLVSLVAFWWCVV